MNTIVLTDNSCIVNENVYSFLFSAYDANKFSNGRHQTHIKLLKHNICISSELDDSTFSHLPLSRFLQAKIILPFLLAKSRAVSNPTPVLAPVTMTVLPLSDLLLLNLNLLFEKPILETVPPMSFHSGLFLEYQINLAIKYIINILKSLFLWNSHASFLSYIK